MHVRLAAFVLALVLPMAAFAQPAPDPQEEPTAEERAVASVRWVEGPAKGELRDIASIDVPKGYIFAPSSDMPKLMEAMHNPVSGKEAGLLAPDDMSWFMVFEYDPVGYVKDDERDELDADALLASIKEGTAAANEERKRRGWESMEIVGWEQTPRYDTASNNLRWAIRARTPSSQVVNYNTRLLGREGVMEVALVCEPQQLAAVMPVAERLLAEYSFNPGRRYAEFKKGDKMAAYGLAALITGGGVAVAAKSGLLAKLLKVLGKGIVVIVAAVAMLAKKLFGKKEEAPS